MKKNNISVVIPAYNCEQTISKTLKSILNQQQQPMEIIIVNDGSTDNTKELCEKYSNEYENVKVINLKNNKGVSNARNTGVLHAKGNYIHFVDSDDTVENNIYFVANEHLKKGNIDCLEFGSNFIYKNKILEKRYIKDEIYCENKNRIADFLQDMTYDDKERVLNVVWNKIYKKEVIVKNNITFNNKINLGEDFLFNCCFFEKMNSYLEINKCLYNYYKNQEGNLTSKFRTDVIMRRKIIYDAWVNLYKNYDIYHIKGESYFEEYEGKLLYYSLYTIFSPNCDLNNIEKEKFLKSIINNEHSKFLNSYLKRGIEKKIIEHSNEKLLLKYMRIKIAVKSIIKKAINK